MRLLIWCERPHGGIADYAHAQANALVTLGVDVEMICSPAFLQGRAPMYTVRPLLSEPYAAAPPRSRLRRRAELAVSLVRNARRVARYARRSRPNVVLTHFSEYLAPLWAWRFRQLSHSSMRFATVLHDPVRDYIVGPRWWHRWSVREAASFIDGTFVHGEAPLPTARRRAWLPHGTYELAPAKKAREALRREFGIPEDAQVLLAYGYVRDNKNLDLVLRAIAQMPDIWLLIAGSEQGGGNRPVDFYRALSENLGCAERCSWLTRFLDAEETANLFAMSDLNLLTYARSFVSASGVLATAAHYRVPSLVSSGLASMRQLVDDYRLGIWVEPDDQSAIVAGLGRWRAGGLAPQWDRYRHDHSWQRNAKLVAAALDNWFASELQPGRSEQERRSERTMVYDQSCRSEPWEPILLPRPKRRSRERFD